jgi:hypothetical protein
MTSFPANEADSIEGRSSGSTIIQNLPVPSVINDSQPFLRMETALKKDHHIERRKHVRHKVQDEVFAMIGPPPSDIGQIVDISLGGFSFMYRGRKKRVKKAAESAFLFEENKAGAYAAPLKCEAKIVSSSEVDGETPSKFTPRRRCSMQFQGLTYYQRLWLEGLIQKSNRR